MKRGLVLGGGGLVGMGYHAGALKALDDWGADLASADVIVGTSAGAILGSYLGAGWTPSDFYDYAHGQHPDAAKDADRQRDEVRQIFVPLWTSSAERVRRSLGSFFAVASARGYWRSGAKGRVPAAPLRRLFPAGMYSSEQTRARLTEDLPQEWPRDGLFICAADLYSGKRVAFGHPNATEAPFPLAVLASTAIPGVFPPVKIGDRQYVDGGIVSATSLDLAVDAGCEAVICVAPLGYRLEGTLPEPKLWGPMIMRSLFARSLRKEVNRARAKGVHVLVVRPWVTELAALGTNAMRHYDRAAVVDASRAGVLRLLESNADHPALRAFTGAATTERAV
jgi:NTE family protein